MSTETERARKLLMIKLVSHPNIIEHSLKVRRKALEIGRRLLKRGFKVDLELLEIGSYLHDIGRSVTQDVRHGIESGKILRKLNFPERVIRMVERHVGAGITAEEAGKLGLPNKNFVPETLEEKILSYADKFFESELVFGNKNGEETVERREVEYDSIEPTLKKFRKMFGSKSPVVLRLEKLKDEMENYLN